MNLSETFILRPIMTTLISITILCLGMWGFFNLPVSNLPDVDYPTITVTVVYPGASPETMANSVAQPLETEFMTIPGISSVTSSNTLGRTNIVLEFSSDKSMDSAAQDVEAALTRAEARLPPNLPQPPNYRKVNPSDSPIMYLALTSDTLTLGELYTYGSTFIGQRLSTISGVAQVLTFGAPYAVRVQVDPGSLATKNLTLQDVSSAMINASPNLPLGQLDGDNQSLILFANGQLKNAAEFTPVIINYQNGAPVRISDVGQAIDSVNNIRTQSKYIDAEHDQLTVVLAIQRQPGANTVAVSKAVREYLPILKDQLPASVSLHAVYDLAESIEDSIQEVEFTLLLAFLLVTAVIFLYLGDIRDTIIPSIAMPMSIIGTFWFMYHLGYSLDNLSLLALTLSTGFIVDDAIVVLENIVRRVEEGEDRWTASLEGTKQISFTILSMTISLVAVFIPMLFMSGLIGKILKEFAVTVAIVILASGVISLTLTPMLCSRFVRVRDSHSKIGSFSRELNDFMLYYYRRTLAWVLDHRILALFVGLLSVIFSLLLFMILPKDFLPEDDIGFFIGYTQAAEGTAPDKMFALQDAVNEVVKNDSNVEAFVSIAGNPQVRQGIFFVHLKPIGERKPILQVIQELYPKLANIAGLQTFLKNIPLINLSVGVNVRGAYQYTMQSLNTQDLYQTAQQMIERMEKLPQLQAVSSDFEIHTPQLNVNILRDEASRLGISADAIEKTLGFAYSGNRVTTIQTPYAEYDVILELLPAYQNNPEVLNYLYMRSTFPNTIPSRILVPLNSVSEWKESIGPASVNHFLQFPSVTVSFNLAPNVALGTALEQIEKIASEVLPANVIGSVQGAAQKFQETTSNFTWLIIIAVFAIYIVLGILYESFIHPLTILSSLPPAILGGLLILYLFNLPLSLYGYLGLILLIGIVKKNGIIMIDYALENQRKNQMAPSEAIYQACLVRFRPIMMTTFAAIMGAVPVAIGFGSGGAARQPLGLVIVGGLILSQIITLYLTPVIYLYMEEYFGEKKAKEST